MQSFSQILFAFFLGHYMLMLCNAQWTVSQPSTPTVSTSSPHVFGYYEPKAVGESQGILEIDGTKLTHLLYAYAYPSESGEVFLDSARENQRGPTRMEKEAVATDDGTFKDVTCASGTPLKGHLGKLFLLKQKNPHLKTILSIGGRAYSYNFSSIVKSSTKRQKFITSSTTLMLEYGFDGIDIDWEFRAQGRNEISGEKTDWNNIGSLFKEIRQYWAAQLSGYAGNFLLTFCLQTIKAYTSGFNVNVLKTTNLTETVDYFLLMGHGSQFNSSVSRFGSPLTFENTKKNNPKLVSYFPEDYAIGSVTESYTSVIPKEKFVMGFPSYSLNIAFDKTKEETSSCIGQVLKTGSRWQRLSYRAVHDLISSQKLNLEADVEDAGAVACNQTHYFTLEIPETVKRKMDYVLANQLAGVMMWDLSEDFPTSHADSLLQAVAEKATLNLENARKDTCSIKSSYCNVQCKEGQDPFQLVTKNVVSSINENQKTPFEVQASSLNSSSGIQKARSFPSMLFYFNLLSALSFMFISF